MAGIDAEGAVAGEEAEEEGTAPPPVPPAFPAALARGPGFSDGGMSTLPIASSPSREASADAGESDADAEEAPLEAEGDALVFR